jgi:hypothetical protein
LKLTTQRTKESPKMATLTGRCLCGNVTYSVQSDPVVTAICHCHNCQRQTGSTYSLVVAVPRDSVSIDGRTLATFDTTTESTGTPSHRQFCSNCGSPLLTLADAAPDLAFIKAGTLDDNAELMPTIEVHCASAITYATQDGSDRVRFPADLPAA